MTGWRAGDLGVVQLLPISDDFHDCEDASRELLTTCGGSCDVDAWSFWESVGCCEAESLRTIRMSYL